LTSFETEGFETGGFDTEGFESGDFETGGFDAGGFDTGGFCREFIGILMTDKANMLSHKELSIYFMYG
jgi:hypothetical protein